MRPSGRPLDRLNGDRNTHTSFPSAAIVSVFHFGLEPLEHDTGAGASAARIPRGLRLHLPQDIHGPDVLTATYLFPVDQGVQCPRGIVFRRAPQLHGVGQELDREAPKTFRTGHRTTEGLRPSLVRLVGRADTHPVFEEVVL